MKGRGPDTVESPGTDSSIHSSQNRAQSGMPSVDGTVESDTGICHEPAGAAADDQRTRCRPRHAVGPEITITTDETPLIAEGIYDAVGGDARVVPIFGRKKLALHLTVLAPDPVNPSGVRHVPLQRFYNVTVGPGGRFRAGRHSAYRREWITVTGRRPARDRLPPSAFKHVLVRVEVRTVTHDSKQRPLPVGAQYSVVSRVIEVQAGGGPRHA